MEEGVCATPKKRMKFSEKIWNDQNNHMPYAFGIGENVYKYQSLVRVNFKLISINNLDIAAVLLCADGMSGSEIIKKYFEGIRGITKEERRIIEVLKNYGDATPAIFFHYDQNNLKFVPSQNVVEQSFQQAFWNQMGQIAH